jgi:MFS family permease
VYQIENAAAAIRAGRRDGRRLPRVGRNVVLLGVVSFLTDVSAEMVATVLPLYLIYTVGLTPLQYGVIDGAYQGATAVVRLAGGVVADRTRRYKEVAAFGYALSAFTKPGFLVVGGAWGGLTGLVLADRVGKGIRTAPRDALISLSSSRERLATAFGVHRTLDTAGAMLGPLLAFAILALTQDDFDAVFVASFSFALMGLGVLLLFVDNRRPGAEEDGLAGPASLRAGLALFREPGLRRIAAVATALSLATISDGFLLLQLQRGAGLDPLYLPLLFVASAAAYMVLAVPVGMAADRLGRGRVFVAGYALLVAVYLSLLAPSAGVAGVAVALLAVGAYYAATDGVLMALVSARLPAGFRGSGLALLVTATSLARLVASVAFGALWTAYGAEEAVAVFAGALAVAAAAGAVLLRRLEPRAHGAPA